MKIKYSVPDNIDPKLPYVRWATWFGCGFLSPAPGTWGSLGALPIGLLLYVLGGPILLLIAICAVSVVGFWAAYEFDKAMDGHDSKMIVIDEVAGMWIALVPAALNPVLIIVAFIAFRFFDIFKPWPVSFFDRELKNAAGVMMDDVIAGLYACLCVVILDAFI